MDFNLLNFTIMPYEKEYGIEVCTILYWDVFQRSLFGFYYNEGDITLDILFFRILGRK